MAGSIDSLDSPPPPQDHESHDALDTEQEEGRTGPKAAASDAAEPDLVGDDDAQERGSVSTAPVSTASIETTTEALFEESVASVDTSPDPSARQHTLGLDICRPWGWDGSMYSDYDVITVHGIRDDYKTAWTDENGKWWVRNSLFERLDIREVDYSYEIDGEATLYEPDGLTLHARKLLAAYFEERYKLDETETDRPIIWICHDLGGTIVKEALCIAMSEPAKYRKISILTTAIIFLGTPHRCQSMSDLEDQLLSLMLLPGPEIREGLLSKAEILAQQVDRINTRFLATKILDRAVIFNLFQQHVRDYPPEPTEAPDTEAKTAAAQPVTPFRRYTHLIGYSFEAAGRMRLNDIDHRGLVHGDVDEERWCSWLSPLFNGVGCPLRVKYQILKLQARVLALAPPTRALDTAYNPEQQSPPEVAWIHEQQAYINFSDSSRGPKLLHLHANGNPLVDIAKVSRHFYLEYDADAVSTGEDLRRVAQQSVVYFEFDQHDSRYNSISALLSYLVNALVWRFWDGAETLISTELSFLSAVHSWSQEDLFHLYSTFRFRSQDLAPSKFTIFISCFEQCPEDQRQWFLEKVLDLQSTSDREYSIIFSTAARDDLAAESFPDNARINLDEMPALRESNDKQLADLRSGLNDLTARRPIFEDVRPQLETLLEECATVPHLGHIILSWLRDHHRGKPRSQISNQISKLSPPTSETVVEAFLSSLAPALRARASTVFSWVKHAAEPWFPASLMEALAVHESPGEEPSFSDLDVDGAMREVVAAFGGIIVIRTDGTIRFSHPSFYHVPDPGIEGSPEDAAAKVNGTIAETCLRYLSLKSAHQALVDFRWRNLGVRDEKATDKLEGGITPSLQTGDGEDLRPPNESPGNLLNTIVIPHPSTSLSEYAVRFWHQHYMASGQFKPAKPVHDLFATSETRTDWEVAYWLFSNSFTRIQRSYISKLPVFAALGLQDLVEEQITADKNGPAFAKDCWFAVTEAARAGNLGIVQLLLKQTPSVDEGELQLALHWAATRADAGIVKLLLDKVPDMSTFQWPDNLLLQATAAGLDDLLAAMLQSGCDVNTKTEIYWGAPLAVTAAWRNHVSTMEVLLNSGQELDLEIKEDYGDSALATAAHKGNPRMVEALLKRGASVVSTDNWGQNPLQRATVLSNYKAIDLLLGAGADVNSGSPDEYSARPPLVAAAELGSHKCVRALLTHGADPNVEFRGATALYKAVTGGNIEVARLLLSHDPKPDMDKIPPEESTLLMAAVLSHNAKVVTLLLEHGAKTDYVDSREDAFVKTPLSRASADGELEIVKILLKHGADINYTCGVSDAPLLAAMSNGRVETWRYLLDDERVDAKSQSKDGTHPIHYAWDNHKLISELLEKGAPIDGYSIPWGTVLHQTARNNAPEAIKALLANDPKPTVDFVYGENDGTNRNEVGCTPLQLACMHRFPECIKLLLDAGADPKFKNKNDEDAIDILFRMGDDSSSTEECFKILLSAPYNVPLDRFDEHGRTRLHRIHETTPVSVVQALLQAKAPLDKQDDDGHTPLSVAVSKGNVEVAKYLLGQGAGVNTFGPSFGSILHLAVAAGNLELAKLLISFGANTDVVDPKFGESLVYTALGIEDTSELRKMLRYLVDEIHVPIDKLGGALRYPILRAADRARTNSHFIPILKFLIRRKARWDVADDSGRCAVHYACASIYRDPIKSLVEAGANIDVKDALGRKPIHFAASIEAPGSSFRYLISKFKDMDINEVDHDDWTPLMWAARSGSATFVIPVLLERKADLWARGSAYEANREWSAAKLMKFSGRPWEGAPSLVPEERTRVSADGETEEWDEVFNESKPGDPKYSFACESCFVGIRGTMWRCVDCDNRDKIFVLCFKCYGHHTVIHNSEHSFEDRGPMYQDQSMSPPSTTGSVSVDALIEQRSHASTPSDMGNSDDARSHKTAGSVAPTHSNKSVSDLDIDEDDDLDDDDMDSDD